MGRIIYIEGSLNSWDIHRNKPLPEQVPQLARNVEKAMRESFSGLEITANESPYTPKEDNPEVVYSSIVHAQAGDSAAYVLMDGAHIRGSEVPIKLDFKASFPLGDYKDRAREAIARIWPYVHSLRALFPSPKEIPPSVTDFSDASSVLLYHQGEPVAIGYIAFQKGLEFSPSVKLATIIRGGLSA